MLEDLAAATGLRARFAVWHPTGISYLEQAPDIPPGSGVSGPRLLPAHATASGKAILAHAPPWVIAGVIKRGLPAYTRTTLTTSEQLHKDLHRTRTSGFAASRGEWRAHEYAMATPVLGPHGAIVGALELIADVLANRAGLSSPALAIAARSLGRQLAADPSLLPDRFRSRPTPVARRPHRRRAQLVSTRRGRMTVTPEDHKLLRLARWENREATFLIGGQQCTRRCDFCQIDTGKPAELDRDEPRRVAESVRTMGLRYSTVTGVARDDLPDGGAWLYAETVRQIHGLNPGTGIELLIPDFNSIDEQLDEVFDSRPEVLAHNLETVPRIFKRIRPAFRYQRSLDVLTKARAAGLVTKSNLILGMGETPHEVTAALRDLHDAGCEIITIVYTVDRIRDGRSFSTRRIVAIQHGGAIFTLSASFHIAENGTEHQFTMPNAPPPESVPLWQDRLREFGDQVPARWLRPRPVEIRYVGDPPWATHGSASPPEATTMVWMRSVGTLPDDPLLHVCVAAYASDMTLLDSVLLAQRLAWAENTVTGASLDHAMWFHAPFRADDWLLYVQEAPATSGARGLARGLIYRRDGRLAVSVVQEGLIRVRQPDPTLSNHGGPRIRHRKPHNT